MIKPRCEGCEIHLLQRGGFFARQFQVGPVDKFSSSHYITGLLSDFIEYRAGES